MWGGLYTSYMHGFILDEAELGFRVACWLDEENHCQDIWSPGGLDEPH